MLHTLRFSLQNAVYFIILHFWFLYYSHFTYRVCQNLNVKLWCQKVNVYEHPPAQWVTVALCTRLKLQKRGSDKSLPRSAEVRSEWSFTATPPACMYRVYREKLTGKFENHSQKFGFHVHNNDP